MTMATAPLAAAPSTLIIACGALARELLDVIALNGWTHMTVTCLPAKLHNEPQRITEAVRAKIRAGRRRHARILCLYGDCGTGGRLDDLLDRYNVPRLAGPHCYEMYGGAAFDDLMAEQPGTFFLTDFLVRGFAGTVLKGLGIDRFPELREIYFANYTRLVYLAQQSAPELVEQARAIADTLGLPLDIRRTGYGQLEARLAELMAVIHEERYRPALPAAAEEHSNGELPDPVLARHPRAGARARRGRAGEQTAARAIPGGD